MSTNDSALNCRETNRVLHRLRGLFSALLSHDGFGEIKIEMRIMSKGCKEVILHCGKQYRFMLDVPQGGSTGNAYMCDCRETNPALKKLHELYYDLLTHDGFGEIRVVVRILKRGQKEVILHCGKQYRFVLDVPQDSKKSRVYRKEDEMIRGP